MASVLVIDDNATNRKVMVALLSHHGHLTFEACDGGDALRVAAESHPHLIISDILMPTMDGLEFLRRLRTIREFNRTPVILYTAQYHGPEAQRLALSAGAARVLFKPCPADKLLQAVEQVLAGVTEPEAEANSLSAANAKFGTLMRLTLSLGAETEPRQQIQKACEGARSVLGSRFALLAVDPDIATSGVDFAGTNESPRAQVERLGEVLRGRSSRRLSGVDASALDLRFPGDHPPASALLVAAFSSPTQNYGWLCLGDKIGASEFSLEDEDALGTLAAQWALA
ncbi:MAG TPA: response regulator, partial [Steroidobacteraceae bacterium]